MKRILGSIAAGIGITGTVLSVVIIWHVWRLADQWSREIPHALRHLESMMASIQEQGEASETLFANARERLETIDTTVAELSKQAEQGPSTGTILRNLDREIEQRLLLAEEFLVSMQAGLQNISNALLFLDSMPLISRRLSTPSQRGGPERQLADVAKTLNETALMLDEATEIVMRLRSGQALPPGQVEQLRTVLQRVDDGLAEIQTEVRLFSESLERTQEQVNRFEQILGARLQTAAAGSTVLLVCFAATQIHLAVQGLALLKPSHRAQDA